jgi:hypothetical protein
MMDARPPVVPERLETLLLARLALPSKTPPSATQLATLTRRFAPTTLTAPEWRALVEVTLAQLQARQIVGTDRRLLNRGELQTRLGPHTPGTWDQWANARLPALALGIDVGDARSRRVLASNAGWVSAIAGRVLGIWQKGPPPSLNRLGAALVWRELGLPGAPEECPPTLRAHFLKRYVATTRGTPVQLVRQLASTAVKAPNPELETIRDALVRTWLGGEELRDAVRAVQTAGTTTEGPTRASDRSGAHHGADPVPPAATDAPPASKPHGAAATPAPRAASLIDAARDAAQAAKDGVFGDRKVFISSVWSALRQRPAWTALALDEFKRQLVAAHRNQQLVLTRADYVAAMDPALVAASETRTDGATFHFIERDPVR